MDETPSLIESPESIREDYRGPNWLYRFKGLKSVAMDSMGLIPSSDSAIPDYVNVSEMSVRALISTPDVDRVGDVVMPMGIEHEDYRRNPMVLWSHSSESGLTLPLGKAENPNGQLELTLTPEGAWSKCWFSRSNLIAAQIFDLVVEKCVRGVSIRETPISQRRVVRDGETITIVDRCNLEEWSLCLLPVQQNAITKSQQADMFARVVGRNRLDGKPIHPSIMKSLTAVCPKPSKPGLGFEESQMKNPNDTDDDGENKDVKPADDKLTTADFAEQAPADQIDTTKSEDGQPMEAEVQGDPKEDSKLGRQGLSYVDDSCKSMRAGIRGICKSLEQPDVKGHLEDIHDRLGSMIDDNKGARDDHYPTSSSLKDEDMGDGESDDSGDDSSDSDSDMKSLLVQSFTGRNQLSAVSTRLKSLAKSTRLTAEERKKLELDILTIDTLRSQAKSHPKPKPKEQKAVAKSVPVEKTPEVPAEDPVKLAELAAKLKSMQDQIKSAKV